jgi:hypothetical protein
VPEPVCSVCGGHPQLLHAGPGVSIDRTGGGSGLNSDKRIYTTVARDRIVEEGDPEAAFLVASAGAEVPTEYVGIYREYRKAKDAPAEPDAEAKASESEAKAVEKPPENKARERSGAK